MGATIPACVDTDDANAEGHQGVFITLTCPSRFHRYMIVNDGKHAVANPKYDGHETPATAHKYLTHVWARARAALARQGLRPYGFRICEPQHDGTPHWHMLLFCPVGQVEELTDTLRRYALQDSGDEKGAQQHRCDFKLIDKARGTAAGYIAKYVAKNIDGEHVGDDLEGRPATESAKRVEAWCSTWRIRQFQQVGGPPVSVWRELRRIKHLPADAPSHLQRAHRAANKQIQNDGDETATVAWDAYCRAQGGAACGRSAAIKLTMRETDALGRYGDAAQPRPAGVETWGMGHCDGDGLAQVAQRWQVASERRVWTIEPAPARRIDWRSFDAESAKPAQPRTRVNNCTRPHAKHSAIGPPCARSAEPARHIPQPQGSTHNFRSPAHNDLMRQLPSQLLTSACVTGSIHGRLCEKTFREEGSKAPQPR